MCSYFNERAAQDRDSRLSSIQFLRALAALGVTLSHTLHFCGYDFRLGTAGVDLFFVISGFIMVYASEKYFGQPHGSRDFIARRLARIVPIYWMTTTVALFLMVFWRRDADDSVMTPAAIAASYFFIPFERSNGFALPVHSVGWTLYYEMFFYVCFSAAVLFSRHTGVLMVAVLLFALVLLHETVALPMPLGYWTDPTLLEFVAGMMIGLLFREGFRLSLVSASVLVIASVGALVVTGQWVRVTPIVGFGIPATIIVGACALTVGSLACTSLTCRIAVFLGEASYALYLVHPFAIDLSRVLIDPGVHPWIFLVLALSLAISAAALVYVAFEKPMTLRLQRRVAAAA